MPKGIKTRYAKKLLRQEWDWIVEMHTKLNAEESATWFIRDIINPLVSSITDGKGLDPKELKRLIATLARTLRGRTEEAAMVCDEFARDDWNSQLAIPKTLAHEIRKLNKREERINFPTYEKTIPNPRILSILKKEDQ